MAKFYARPLLGNGTEALGNPVTIDEKWIPGILSGSYVSLDNFVRYQIVKFGNGHRRWNIYLNDIHREPAYVVIVDSILSKNGWRHRLIRSENK